MRSLEVIALLRQLPALRRHLLVVDAGWAGTGVLSVWKFSYTAPLGAEILGPLPPCTAWIRALKLLPAYKCQNKKKPFRLRISGTEASARSGRDINGTPEEGPSSRPSSELQA